MLWLYTALWRLLTPFALLYLWGLGLRQAAYRQARAQWAQRLGWGLPRYEGKRLLWLHTASVGEVRAAAPLAIALLERYPHHSLLLTTTTPTGQQTARDLLGRIYGVRLLLCYLPFDLPGAMQRLIRHFRPEFALILEVEYWPNLLHQAARMHLPVYLLNARLSARSAQRYQSLAGLISPALATLVQVGAQTSQDAERLTRLGAPQVSVTGNLKYDYQPSETLVALGQNWRHWIGARPVWLAASTREGEEALLLTTLATIKFPQDALLILLPRHPHRCVEVERLLKNLPGSPRFLRRSAWGGARVLGPEVRILLGDSLGELAAYCAASDVVLMGGSLLNFGCHNVIEPCAQGVPVVVGPSTHNFSEAVHEGCAAGAIRCCADARWALQGVADLLEHSATRQAMALAGQAFVHQHRGAMNRTLALLPLRP